MVRFIFALAVAGAFLWFAGILAAPVLKAAGHRAASSFLYDLVYSNVCHQRPDRSFFLAGEKLAVCSRCTGIYLSFALTLLLYLLKPAKRLTPSVFFLLLSPMVLEKGLELTGFSTNNLSRFISGLCFGIMLGMAFSEGLLQLLQRRFK